MGLTKKTFYVDDFDMEVKLPTVQQVLAVCGSMRMEVLIDYDGSGLYAEEWEYGEMRFRYGLNGPEMISPTKKQDIIRVLDYLVTDCYLSQVTQVDKPFTLLTLVVISPNEVD